jgi:hypothetical protein
VSSFPVFVLIGRSWVVNAVPSCIDGKWYRAAGFFTWILLAREGVQSGWLDGLKVVMPSLWIIVQADP